MILKPQKKHVTTTLKVDVPESLLTDARALAERARERGLIFDIDEVLTRALSRAVRVAGRELEKVPAAVGGVQPILNAAGEASSLAGESVDGGDK